MGDLQNNNNDELLNLILSYKNINWIELGVFRGVNAKYVFENYDIKKMYLIDPYVPLDYLQQYFGTEEIQNESKKIAKNNLIKYNEKCIWLEDFSENIHGEISNESADIIYIDGNHSFETVLSDLQLYYPKIKSGGLIIGDDYNEGGVAKAIEVFSKEKNISYNISHAKKTGDYYHATHKFWFIK